MFRKRAQTMLCLGLITFGSAYLIGCGSGGTKTNPGGTAGKAGTAGSGSGGTGTAGSPGAGGTSSAGAPGTGGAAGTPSGTGTVCLAVSPTGLITDFTFTAVDAGATGDQTFGDFTTTLSGGEFIFPAASADPTADGGSIGLTQDLSGGNWHITGNVTTYSGFGLYTTAPTGGCSLIDASSFTGIQFSVQSNLATPVAMTLALGTAANDITAEWLNANTVQTTPVANFGRCTPSGVPAGQYDGTCAAPSATIMLVTPGVANTITIPFANLVGGRPQAGLTPSEITFIAWSVPFGSYPLDIVIDDLKFIR